MKSDLLYIDHILECIRRVEEYVAGGEAAFFSSSLIQDAVLRNLQVLAESSQPISPERRTACPEVPWRQMSGFRNVAVHDYFDIDPGHIWKIVCEDLLTVKRALQTLREGVIASEQE